MNPGDFYRHILSEMPDGVERQVYAVLKNHVGEGNKISLDALAREVFGKATDTTQRQTREAIEILRRDYRIAVLSRSGTSGRWLAADEAEREACLADLESRHKHLGEVIRGVRMAVIPVRCDPFTELAQATQQGLWQ